MAGLSSAQIGFSPQCYARRKRRRDNGMRTVCARCGAYAPGMEKGRDVALIHPESQP
jgi:hypothetical protein